MGVPRAKRKKRINEPSKPEQTRIMEANWLCMAVAIEQLYTDCGWRVKRINKLVNGFWLEMTEAQRLQNEDGIRKVPDYVARQADTLIDVDIRKMCRHLDDYRKQCYMLCVGCLVKAMRKLKITKIRCQLIVGAIFYEQKNFEAWSIYKNCADITGFDVRANLQWR